jgi:hypothetical protein
VTKRQGLGDAGCRSALRSVLIQLWCNLGTCGTFAGIDDKSVISRIPLLRFEQRDASPQPRSFNKLETRAPTIRRRGDPAHASAYALSTAVRPYFRFSTTRNPSSSRSRPGRGDTRLLLANFHLPGGRFFALKATVMPCKV